jgi:amino acid transporter
LNDDKQFYIAVDPIGGGTPRARVESFFKSYLALPIVLVFWGAGYFWKRTGWLSLSQIDVDTGRRQHDWVVIQAEREALAQKGAFKRMVHFLF